MDWAQLQNDNPVIQSVIADWTNLLAGNYKEHTYHEFLKNHAGLFLVDGRDSFFAVSKLKIGSEHETDFAIPVENHSAGLYWNLIELKTPNALPYTSTGIPSSTLSKAIQQVQDWYAWLDENRSAASKLFLTKGLRMSRKPNLKFTIIIGTRANSEKYLEKRNELGRKLNIEIRSFDYLTDRLKRRVFTNRSLLLNGTWDEKHFDEGNRLANPFFKALAHSKWKALISEPGVSYPHFTSTSLEHLLRYLELDEVTYNMFCEWQKIKA